MIDSNVYDPEVVNTENSIANSPTKMIDSNVYDPEFVNINNSIENVQKRKKSDVQEIDLNHLENYD